MEKPGGHYSGENGPLAVFYDEVFKTAHRVEQQDYGYTATFPDIDVPLGIVENSEECELLHPKVRWMDGFTAFVKFPDGKLIVLTEVNI